MSSSPDGGLMSGHGRDSVRIGPETHHNSGVQPPGPPGYVVDENRVRWTFWGWKLLVLAFSTPGDAGGDPRGPP